MSEKADIYQQVTDAIIARLDAGVIPWHAPFSGYGSAGGGFIPRNYSSNRPYRGINVFLLAFAGYSSLYWLTFDGAKQAAYEQAERAAGRKPAKLDKTALKRLGAAVGGVRKGERSTLVIFWKMLLIDDPENPGKKKKIPLLRYFRVFNVEQCDGVDPTRGVGEQPEADVREFDPIDECESVVGAYLGREGAPRLRHGGDVALYSPSVDLIRVPDSERFDHREEYYSTLFHEMTHSTGHKDRLARKGIESVSSIGHIYADEELVAEMGAAMLCGVAGIAPAVVDNAASYIDHWRKRISDDPKLVVNAAARAQRAADYVLGTTFGDAPAASVEPVLANA